MAEHVYAPTAQAEILKVIKQLDKEEARTVWLAAKQETEAAATRALAVALANKRRQYEYALATLGGEINAEPVPQSV